MAGFVLFQIYQGHYRHAVSNVVMLFLGTILLWFLCVAKFTFVAYTLLLLPVLFFVCIVALLVFDQSFLDIRHRYMDGSHKEHGDKHTQHKPCCPTC